MSLLAQGRSLFGKLEGLRSLPAPRDGVLIGEQAVDLGVSRLALTFFFAA